MATRKAPRKVKKARGGETPTVPRAVTRARAKMAAELARLRDDDAIWIAVHEAGHAVVAWCAGIKIRSISLGGEAGSNGSVALAPPPYKKIGRRSPRLVHPAEMPISASHREALEKQVMVAMGGYLAEHMFQNLIGKEEGNISGSFEDVDSIASRLAALAPFLRERVHYHEMLKARVMALLDIYQPLCWTLACELHEAKRLSGALVTELLDLLELRHHEFVLARIASLEGCRAGD